MTEKLQQDAGDAAFALALSALTNLESRNTKKAREDISRLLVTLRIPIGADDPLTIFNSNFATVCNRLGICEYVPMILASLDDGHSDFEAFVVEKLQYLCDEKKPRPSKGSNASKPDDQHRANIINWLLIKHGHKEASKKEKSNAHSNLNKARKRRPEVVAQAEATYKIITADSDDRTAASTAEMKISDEEWKLLNAWRASDVETRLRVWEYLHNKVAN